MVETSAWEEDFKARNDHCFEDSRSHDISRYLGAFATRFRIAQLYYYVKNSTYQQQQAMRES